MKSKKYLLQERDIPQAWYNVIPDMAVKPSPLINPATKEPLKAEDLVSFVLEGGITTRIKHNRPMD